MNTEEKNKEAETASTSEEKQQTDETEVKVETKVESDIKSEDFDKELQAIESKKPRYSELEKAKYSLKKIQDRIKDLGGEAEIEEPEEDVVDKTAKKVLRTQAEERARSVAKSDAEVKVIMHYYDLLGNFDDALWQAHKGRTKNALEEVKRKPNSPGMATGAGQRSPEISIPVLPPDQVKNLQRAGMKEIKPGRWEGKFITYFYDKDSKSWISAKKS